VALLPERDEDMKASGIHVGGYSAENCVDGACACFTITIHISISAGNQIVEAASSNASRPSHMMSIVDCCFPVNKIVPDQSSSISRNCLKVLSGDQCRYVSPWLPIT
jgi:hypothetical protein